jgi:acetate---CoA ligase (ADP-forming)
MALPLRQLLAPTSVAVVGASQREDALGTTVIRNLQTVGFAGRVAGVNPRYSEVAGVPCYPSIADVPDELDAVFVAVPAAAGPDLVDEAAARGVKAIFINASGYADGGTEDGRARQGRIQAAAREHGIAICGPNNTGILNLQDHVAMWTAPMPELKTGPMAVITQSGSASMVLSEGPRDIGLSYVITCGNEAVVSVADYLDYVVTDDRVHLVVLFLETIRRPDVFARAARKAARRGTRIVALKIGRSESGRAAVMAHTGSFAGDDAVYRAFLRKHGIVQANDLDELIELAVLFGTSPDGPPTPSVVPITFSGGEAALVADIGTALGLEMSELASDAIERIHDALPPFTVVRNPLDAFGLGFDPEKFRVVVDGLLKDPDVGTIAPAVDAPASGGIDADYAVEISKLFLELDGHTDKRFALINNASSTGLFEPVREQLRGTRIPFLNGMREGLAALGAWASYQPPGDEFTPDATVLDNLRQVLDRANEADEVDRTRLLKQAGLPMAPAERALSRDEAVAVADRLGYPVVLKGSGRGLGHKSDLGLVRPGLVESGAVARSFDEVSQLLANARVAEPVIFLQPMIGPGIELIVGVRIDPAFGPVIVAGLGGIFVEVIKDVALRLGPVDSESAAAMLNETAAGRLLAGNRGSPPFDLGAAAEAISRLSVVGAAARKSLHAIEINPLIVLERGKGAFGVDALIE